MQTMMAKIEGIRVQSPDVLGDSKKVRQLISAVTGGKDAWGHEILYLTRRVNGVYSYVLVSLGSDGKPDLPQIQAYFTLAEQSIHETSWRDIVFRDGHAITRAGK